MPGDTKPASPGATGRGGDNSNPITLSRPLTQTYRCQALAALAKQLLYAPPDKRVEQVFRAEKLHDEIDPTINYPLDFLWYRVTGYHREEGESVVLVGEAILSDLRLMIDVLSRSVTIRLDEHNEPAESVDELAQRLNVSTKTIGRWRRLGLRWRWVLPPGKRHKSIVLMRTAVDRFLAQHPSRVERAAGFDQIPTATRRALIRRAKRLAGSREVSLNRVAAHLAQKLGRGHETIRQILLYHDKMHPNDPIFVDRTVPLNGKQKRVISRAYRMGVPVSHLARRFRRTRSTIYRAIRERRAAAIRRMAIDYRPLAVFERDDADDVILRPGLMDEVSRALEQTPLASMESVQDLPQVLRPLYRLPSLPAVLQRSLLVRFNYLKYKASHLRRQLDRYEPRSTDLTMIEQWLKQAAVIRDRLIGANLGLVLSVVRRHMISQTDRSTSRLVTLLELANATLMEAVDQFDIATGRPFEAYLNWRLMQRFVKGDALDGQPTRAYRRIDPKTILNRLEAAAQSVSSKGGG